MKEKVVSATEFKAKCLTMLDAIEEHGGPITITRRGRPVAVLSAAKKKTWKSPANSWAERAEIVGDIVNSDPELWDVTCGE
jgi:prevent-host-death family protein